MNNITKGSLLLGLMSIADGFYLGRCHAKGIHIEIEREIPMVIGPALSQALYYYLQGRNIIKQANKELEEKSVEVDVNLGKIKLNPSPLYPVAGIVKGTIETFVGYGTGYLIGLMF